MSLNIADNFSYLGKKPNFLRDTFATRAEMRDFPDTNIDEGHVSLCLEDGQRYEYWSTNPISGTTGRWKRIIDTYLDESSENPVQNKVILKNLKTFQEKITDSLSSIRNDFIQTDNFISNNSFNEGLLDWQTEHDKKFFSFYGRYIFGSPQGFLSKAGDSSVLTTDSGRTVIKIRNKYIMQYNRDFTAVPNFPTDYKGLIVPQPIVVQFSYKVIKPGTLRISFEDPYTETTEPEYVPFEIEEDLSPLSGYENYVLYKRTGKWNGTGNFKISFTGEINIYMIVLAQSDLELFENRYQQLFTNSDKLASLASNKLPLRYITSASVEAENQIRTTDRVVLCYNTSSRRLVLPADCENGQSLEIKKCNSGSVTITIPETATGNYFLAGTDQVTSIVISDNINTTVRLIYDSDNKFWVKL